MATGRVPTTANSPLTAKGDLFGYSTTQARVAVGNDGETLVADSSTSTGLRYQGTMAGGKNVVINGAMDIWQRGTANVTTASAYTADRWQKESATHYGVSRQTTSDTTNLPNIQYCARVQRTSGSTSLSGMGFAQSIENAQSYQLIGKTVVMSFWARAGANYSAASSALTTTLYSGTGTDANVTSSWSGTATVATSNITLTTTWQRFSITGTVASSATQLAVYINANPSGTAGANDYYEITGVQVELGSVATAFTRAGGTIQGELAACQRYYFRLGGNQVYQVLGGGTANGTTQCDVQTPLPVTMRVIPSSVDYSTVALQQKGGSPLNAVTSVTLGLQSPSLANTSFNVASGLTDGAWHRLMTNNSTSAYLAYNAEL